MKSVRALGRCYIVDLISHFKRQISPFLKFDVIGFPKENSSFSLQLSPNQYDMRFRPSEEILGTLRYGDYGLRTTDGRYFRTGTRHMCSVVPTVASSRRCVVEGFHVVQRGVVRATEDGMKK